MSGFGRILILTVRIISIFSLRFSGVDTGWCDFCEVGKCNTGGFDLDKCYFAAVDGEIVQLGAVGLVIV